MGCGRTFHSNIIKMKRVFVVCGVRLIIWWVIWGDPGVQVRIVLLVSLWYFIKPMCVRVLARVCICVNLCAPKKEKGLLVCSYAWCVSRPCE